MTEENAEEQLPYYKMYDPEFAIFSRTADGEEYCDLKMQTFKQVYPEVDHWQSDLVDKWPIVATFTHGSVVIFPIHRNPRVQRYLRPVHGALHRLEYTYKKPMPLPRSTDEARDLLRGQLPWQVMTGPMDGEMGLVKDLGPVWRSLVQQRCDALVIENHGPVERTGSVVTISVDDLELLAKNLARVERRIKKQISGVKSHLVMAQLLTKTDPDRFQALPNGGVLPTVMISSGKYAPQKTSQIPRSAVRASLESARRTVGTAAIIEPSALTILHAEIEVATLDAVIKEYENRLIANLTEPSWQAYFEKNLLVLKLVFTRPVRLIHRQPHVHGSGLPGSGAQIGDFFLAERGQALALVEIKRPSTELLATGAYRPPTIYAPSKDLSGAITQTLFQKSEMAVNWSTHLRDDRDVGLLVELEADVIRCIVLAGTLPNDPKQRRSFNVFRHACKDVEVITYDELLGKMKLLRDGLKVALPQKPQGTTPYPDLF